MCFLTAPIAQIASGNKGSTGSTTTAKNNTATNAAKDTTANIVGWSLKAGYADDDTAVKVTQNLVNNGTISDEAGINILKKFKGIK